MFRKVKKNVNIYELQVFEEISNNYANAKTVLDNLSYGRGFK